MSQGNLIDSEEFEEIFGLKKTYLYSLVNNQKLQATHIGKNVYVDQVEVRRYLDGRCQANKNPGYLPNRYDLKILKRTSVCWSCERDNPECGFALPYCDEDGIEVCSCKDCYNWFLKVA